MASNIEHKKHSEHHHETVRHHNMAEMKDLKLRSELAGQGAGKGSHRRKGANNNLFRSGFDEINWNSKKKDKKKKL